jgi:DNA primase
VAKRYSAADITAVREGADIGQVIGDVVHLVPAGGGRLKGLCVFHDERSPSLQVNPSDGFFHCFGCQVGGDAIRFMRDHHGLSFSEALETLADRFNIHIEPTEDNTHDVEVASPTTRIYAANLKAAEFFKDTLLSGNDPLGIEFVRARQFDPVAAAQDFGVGYAPQSGRALAPFLMKNGFSEEEIIDAGLVSKHNGTLYDVFQGRPTWAIRDALGRVVGFGARKIRDDDRREGKFVNTSETPVYKKSKVLYGLDMARKAIAKSKQAVVVEGYADVMSMHMAGITNTVATCGTALTEDHLLALRRLVGDDGEIVFAFDGDAAGQKAALKAYATGKKTLRRLSVLDIEGGKDPDELRKAEGLEALEGLLQRRRPLIEAVIRATVAATPLNSPEDRVTALDRVGEQMADVLDPILRGQYAPLVAELLSLPLPDVSRVLNVESITVAHQPVKRVGPARSFERDALQLVAQHPELSASAQLLDESLFVSQHAMALLPIFTWWLWGADTSRHALIDSAPPELVSAVREIIIDEIQADDVDAYGEELLMRLMIAKTERQIAELKAHTATHPEDRAAYARLRELRGYRHKLKG